MDLPYQLRGHELLLYATVAAYTVAMLLAMPSGDSRQVPILVVPLLLVLVVYRLLTRTSRRFDEGVHARLVALLGALTARDSGDDDLMDQYIDDDDDDDEHEVGESSGTSELTMIGWILAGFGIMYAFGVVVGGLVFGVAFVTLNGLSVRQAIVTSATLVGLLWVLSSALRIRLWGGLFDVLQALGVA
ncbi:hypothetical protein [Salinigranum sp. GCM10025319]|uniref:hypothetical protein n=1 Tax=Salinigranum sp. GCM10025319 TaxID=3252687 RepID=UPI0036076E5B